jgi:hypothetical protein
MPARNPSLTVAELLAALVGADPVPALEDKVLADGRLNAAAASHFAANEPATFECSLDAAVFAACSCPLQPTGLAEGGACRSTDRARRRPT